MGSPVTSKLLGSGDPRDSVRPRPATTPAREEAAPKMYNGTAALSEPCRRIGVGFLGWFDLALSSMIGVGWSRWCLVGSKFNLSWQVDCDPRSRDAAHPCDRRAHAKHRVSM